MKTFRSLIEESLMLARCSCTSLRHFIDETIFFRECSSTCERKQRPQPHRSVDWCVWTGHQRKWAHAAKLRPRISTEETASSGKLSTMGFDTLVHGQFLCQSLAFSFWPRLVKILFQRDESPQVRGASKSGPATS